MAPLYIHPTPRYASANDLYTLQEQLHTLQHDMDAKLASMTNNISQVATSLTTVKEEVCNLNKIIRTSVADAMIASMKLHTAQTQHQPNPITTNTAPPSAPQTTSYTSSTTHQAQISQPTTSDNLQQLINKINGS